MRRSQNFEFLGLRILPSDQFWGAPTHADIIECNLKIRRLGAKLCVAYLLF